MKIRRAAGLVGVSMAFCLASAGWAASDFERIKDNETKVLEAKDQGSPSQKVRDTIDIGGQSYTLEADFAGNGVGFAFLSGDREIATVRLTSISPQKMTRFLDRAASAIADNDVARKTLLATDANKYENSLKLGHLRPVANATGIQQFSTSLPSVGRFTPEGESREEWLGAIAQSTVAIARRKVQSDD